MPQERDCPLSSQEQRRCAAGGTSARPRGMRRSVSAPSIVGGSSAPRRRNLVSAHDSMSPFQAQYLDVMQDVWNWMDKEYNPVELWGERGA
eukprot:5619555-Prorocentrum_lima.AAC.1